MLLYQRYKQNNYETHHCEDKIQKCTKKKKPSKGMYIDFQFKHWSRKMCCAQPTHLRLTFIRIDDYEHWKMEVFWL